MRETRTSGSEGGARFYPLSVPYLHAYALSLKGGTRIWC
jgi:hypothetical protein